MKQLIVIIFMIFSAFSYAQNKQSITMVTDQWDPYYGSELKNNGPVAEITSAVLAQLDYQLQVSFIPWKRAVEYSKNGKYQAVLGGYYNQQRAEHFWYSDSIATSDIVLFSQVENRVQVTTIASLNNQRVCVINGYFNGESFKKNQKIVRVKSNTLKHCFERLIAGRVDYLVANRLVGLALLNKEFVEDKSTIQPMPLLLAQEQIYILWSKNVAENFELNKQFNRALQQLINSGKVQQIWQKHGY
ncbi:MAG: amino acid ABC transporter substrate-binding protein [Psychromonas sp.]|nr:amino acid ABC transporter substrate-binding protein [Alteromonadales bacterium]MCP5078441.1 amino acid ABC transporter substrate-binding protein [Psychromonas sp.]